MNTKHILVNEQISLDDYFHSIPENEKLVLNTLNPDDPDDMLMIDKTRIKHIEGDSISLVDSCFLGCTTGNYNRGIICEECRTEVKDRITDYNPYLWMKMLLPDVGWLSASFASTLMKTIYYKERNIIKWFSNPRYNPPIKTNNRDNVHKLYAEYTAIDGFERSYSFLINNLEEIIKITIQHFSYKADKKAKLSVLLSRLIMDRDAVFSQYMPIINNKFAINEQTNKGIWLQQETLSVYSMTTAFMNAINSNTQKQSKAVGEIVVINANLRDILSKDTLGTKYGIIRKNLIGTRASFSAYLVISPITEEHRYDDIHMPWSASVVILRPMILNKLIKRGIKFREALNLIRASVKNYSSVIREIFDELLSEAEDNRLTFQILRNPTQGSYGTHLVGCPKIKDNPNDTTMGVSQLLVQLPNGDYDGDALIVKLHTDKYMKELASNYHPSNDIFGDKPGKIFGKVNLTKTVAINIATGIREERKLLGI